MNLLEDQPSMKPSLVNKINWYQFTGLAIDSSRINIFKIEIDQCFQVISIRYHNYLSKEELEKASRFLHETDKRRFIVSRYLLRVILADCVGLHPTAVRFHEVERRKPATEGISFNLSYSANFLVIGLGRNPLGIDIEFKRTDFNFETLLEDCFCAEEQDFINQGHKRNRFYTLWTRKEAILKATGEGITDDLRDLQCMQDIVRRNSMLWRVSTFLVTDDYVLSFAIGADEDKPLFWNYKIT